jgi:hypothetical protein
MCSLLSTLAISALPIYGSAINGSVNPTDTAITINAAITPDGTWHEFLFDTATSPVTACAGGCLGTVNPVAVQDAPPWTFTGPAFITVLDLFNHGDRFQLFDNAVSLGTTSVIINDAIDTCGNNIGCALADVRYSRLVATVGAGAHSLTLNVIQNASGISGGAAVFQAAPVPEPATMMLMGGVLVAIGLFHRSRRAK